MTSTLDPTAESGGERRCLREMRWTDIPAVAAVEQHCFPLDPWQQSTFWAELAQRPRRDYLVVSAEGGLRAYGGTDLLADTVDLMTLAVAPQWRGRAYGASLLTSLLRRAGAAGARRVMLEIRADNAPAMALYRAFGLRVVHTRGHYYRDGTDALVMQGDVR